MILQKMTLWRRERDSNPREAVSPYTISSRARSSTPAPLREVGSPIIPRVYRQCPPELPLLTLAITWETIGPGMYQATLRRSVPI